MSRSNAGLATRGHCRLKSPARINPTLRTSAARAAVVLALAASLAACSRSAPPPDGPRPLSRPSVDPRTGTSASQRIIADGSPIPKGGGYYKVGVPYRISGRWYYPKEDPTYDQRGIASWYGDDFHGRKTANGEIYDMHGLSAAHPTLPMPSYVWVTNEANGRTLLVRVNDRGPYAHDRVIDLSRAVARAIGSEGRGLAQVRVRYAGPAPLSGDDGREQAHLRNQPWYRPGDQNVAAAPRRTPYVRSATAIPAVSLPAPSAQWRPTNSRLPLAPALRTGDPPPAAGHGRHYVAAGTFRSEANAQRRADEVRRFAPADVVPAAGGADPVFRVRTGAMDEATAQRLRQRLADAGIIDTVIVAD
ncbi:MAG: septal ring lytic transglycosylase RlpA family protein [Hyphomicrobiaceae bacterium]